MCGILITDSQGKRSPSLPMNRISSAQSPSDFGSSPRATSHLILPALNFNARSSARRYIVAAAGTGITLDVKGTNDAATLSNGTATVEASDSLTLTGNSDAITQRGSSTVTTSGSGLRST